MSDVIRTYYEHAQFSDAAYANLAVGMAQDLYVQALKARGFGSLQATEFANRYSIVSTFSDTATGFSATLFQRNGTNEKILAIRGTNDVVDFLTSNLQIGLLGMASQYTSLNTFYLQLIVEGKLSSTDQLTVTGHSLGGYLAQAFTVDHLLPVSHAYTYNAPGFGGVLINPFGSLGVAGTSIPDSLITNITAQGHSFVASQGRQIGEPENAFIETTLNPLTNHGIRSLVDALALYDLVARIDSTVSMLAITNILNAASVTGTNSLENGLDALRKLFQGSTVATTSIGNRETYYTNLIALRDSLPATSSYRIDSLVDASNSTVFSQAKNPTADGLAYRYALRELNSFAVIGADYGPHNIGGALDLYNAQTGNGAMTAIYLSDRAELLAKRLAVNVNDGGSVPTDTHFVDMRTGFEVGSMASANEVIFGDTQDNRDLLGHAGGDHLYGGEGNDFLIGQGGMDYLEGNAGDDEVYGGTENDTLLGQQGNDELFGEAGNDQLNGGLGNDRLEGGTGLDVYFYRTGQGSDTIADGDRLGIVRFDNTILQGGLHRSTDPANTYVSPDGQFTFVKSGANLVINNTLTIENFDFQNGALGIKLAEVPETTLPAVPIINYDNNGLMSEEINLPASGSWIIERVEAKNYIFSAGQGSYRIYAGPGNDQLYGGPNYDRLSSRSGNDLLQGFGGNDDLYGWEDDDVLQGGDGDDRLYGDLALEQAGQDYLDGGAGDDLVVGGSGNDVLLGGVGNDMLWGEGGTTELIIIPPGDPNQTGFSFVMDYSLGAGEDTLDGGTGDDSLVGSAGADILLGGDGIDVLYGDHNGGETLMPWDPAKDGEDYLDGGAGNDWLHGGGLADILIGGSGDDRLFGEGVLYGALGGDDWLEGGEGTDQLYGGLGADALFGGIGDDLLVGDYENEAGSDDMLDGGAGMDELQGGGGNDLLIGGSENDRLFGQDGDDTLSGDAGDDELQGGLGDDDLFGGAGNDFLLGQEGADLLDGEEGDDLLKGGDGNDALFGGEGIDDLQGDLGNDALAGDAGNDFLYGDGNNPTVLDLVGGDDSLDGGEGDDLLYAGAGQDQLFGGTGTDQLVGDVGDDQLYGDEGNDLLVGDSTLFPAQAGADFLDGGHGDDGLLGGGGNDQLEGGTGNDSLVGGAGSDTYRFNFGHGVDSIEDIGGENNRLVFGDGITADTLTLDVGANNSLVIRVGPNGDTVKLVSFYVDSSAEFYPINRFEFADGTFLSDSELLSRGFHLSAPANGGTVHGTDFDDTIEGSHVEDWLEGHDGNDILNGKGGDDELRGDAGDDVIDGGSGDDRLDGGFGVNVLRGGEGNDRLESRGTGDQLLGGAGDDVYRLWSDSSTIVEEVTAGVDTIQLTQTSAIPYQTPDHVENMEILGDILLNPEGRVDIIGNALANQLSGSDRLDGREGNDTLIGGGDNIYVFGRGYGQDVIQTGTQTYASQNFIDYIQLVAGVVPADVTFEGQGNHLVMKIAGTSDQITVENYLIEPGLRTPTVGEIHFDGGTIWGETEIASRVRTLTGTSGNDTLTGFANDNDLFGLDGHDQLLGYGGADRLDGGAGNDLLNGGDGNDTYLFGRGGGQDRVSDFPDSGTTGEVDTVLLDNTITPVDIRLQATAESGLLLTINSTADQLLVESYFLGSIYQIEQIRFADGTTWDAAAIASRTEGLTLVGIEDPDTLTGMATNDTLSGLGDDDILTGQGGHDLLLGGDGNDSLDGGFGNDTLDGGFGIDTLVGGSGNDIYVVDDPGDMVTEQTNQGTDTIQSAITYTLGVNVEHLTLIGSATINGTGNGGNNTLTGNSAANVLTGGTGNDTYVVGVGDTVVEAASGGTDTVQSVVDFTLGANIEKLTLTGTAAINGTGNTLNNTLIGNSGANVLSGGTGADAMTGGAGHDTYVIDNAGDTVTENANEGIDTVQSSRTYTLGANIENLTLTGTTAINGTGNALDNVLTGNSGANVLTGGAGNDTYVVGAGDSVVENASAGTDTVQSSITWTLGANLENLTLTGTTTINGTGNASNNTLGGNSANNTLTGLGGNDTYLYSRGGGQDKVIDNSGTSDTISFGSTINPQDLILSKQANDLRLSVYGTSDQVTIQNWYLGASNQTEVIQAGNGQQLMNTQVNQLIQAMAGFTQQTGLSWEQAVAQRPQDVQQILAASWQ